MSGKELERAVFNAVRDQVGLVLNLEKALEYIDNLPSADRRVFSYETQIAKIEEEIERCKKLKLRLYEDLADGVITKTEYMDFRDSYTKAIEQKTEALANVQREHRDAIATGVTERSWVTLFRQYENIEALNRRVLMALVDQILIHENHVIEIIFKYRDEYERALNYASEYAETVKKAV